MCLAFISTFFSLAQIVVEEFLEDINNMLNSGEVPNLFASDEYEKIIAAVRPMAKEHGIPEGDRYVFMSIYHYGDIECVYLGLE